MGLGAERTATLCPRSVTACPVISVVPKISAWPLFSCKERAPRDMSARRRFRIGGSKRNEVAPERLVRAEGGPCQQKGGPMWKDRRARTLPQFDQMALSPRLRRRICCCSAAQNSTVKALEASGRPPSHWI